MSRTTLDDDAVASCRLAGVLWLHPAARDFLRVGIKGNEETGNPRKSTQMPQSLGVLREGFFVVADVFVMLSLFSGQVSEEEQEGILRDGEGAFVWEGGGSFGCCPRLSRGQLLRSTQFQILFEHSWTFVLIRSHV
jgi:hypothetical protein